MTLRNIAVRFFAMAQKEADCFENYISNSPFDAKIISHHLTVEFYSSRKILSNGKYAAVNIGRHNIYFKISSFNE